MGDTSLDKSTVDHSFMPILALESAYHTYFTPFNFIPLEFAYQAYKLQILASVPFELLRIFAKNEESSLIEFTYKEDGLSNISQHLAKTCRPVILWISNSSQDRIKNLITSIYASKPFLFLIIVEDTSVANYLSNLNSANSLTSILCFTDSAAKEDERPLLIWKAYLELLVKMEKLLPNGHFLMNLPPDRSVNRTFGDLLAAAQTGNISEFTIKMDAIPVYDDFIYYPNAIIASFLRYKIPTWIKGPVLEENKNKVYEYAKEIRERKSLSILIDQIIYAKGRLAEQRELSPSIIKNFYVCEKILPKEFFQPLLDISNGLKSVEEMRAIYTYAHTSYPKDVFYSYSIPEFILVCQSYPFDYIEAIDITKIISPSSLQYLLNEDEDLYRNYFEQIIKGGRSIRFEVQTDDERNMKTIKSIGELVRTESNYISALSVLYGLRRQCPVFKTQRAGRPIFTLFHQLDRLIYKHNNKIINEPSTGETKDVAEIESLMNNLSDQITTLIDPKILSEIYSCQRDPRVFLLSDIPLDFVRTQTDYFGYTAMLTRLPITPGKLPLEYYNKTGSFTDLDNDKDHTVIVTSFLQDSRERGMLESIRKAFNYHESVSILDIDSKFELINYVNNNRKIKCLIFFGHGGIERNSNESWIQLPKDNFFNSDIQKLKYIPKTVILVGCNTSSGGNTISGMDIPFLQRGAQVVATTFPIPLMLGTLFIGMFLSNFLSAGVNLSNGVRHYADLSDILTIVKRRLRINSILLNLQSQGKLLEGEEFKVMDKYIEKLEILENKDKGNDENPLIAIKQALFEERFIDSYDIPLYEIEKIPYCLFFTCLGYTLSNKNKNLKI